MTARYLIRLDDACPTMDRERWSRLETVLDAHGIRPMVAVVPDNLDPVLQVDEPDPNFWDRVRFWQSKGWTIAMHGYQHAFHPVERKKLILPFYDRSEFAGLSLEAQSEKIRKSWALFQSEGVAPTAWIAPAHCFDLLTLHALRAETPIRLISDGVARHQFYEADMFWLPQQLWSLKPRKKGLWTMCVHPNGMSYAEIEALDARLSSDYFQPRICSVEDVELTRRKKSFLDHLYNVYFWRRTPVIEILLRLRQWRRERSAVK